MIARPFKYQMSSVIFCAEVVIDDTRLSVDGQKEVLWSSWSRSLGPSHWETNALPRRPFAAKCGWHMDNSVEGAQRRLRCPLHLSHGRDSRDGRQWSLSSVFWNILRECA